MDQRRIIFLIHQHSQQMAKMAESYCTSLLHSYLYLIAMA